MNNFRETFIGICKDDTTSNKVCCFIKYVIVALLGVLCASYLCLKIVPAFITGYLVVALATILQVIGFVADIPNKTLRANKLRYIILSNTAVCYLVIWAILFIPVLLVIHASPLNLLFKSLLFCFFIWITRKTFAPLLANHFKEKIVFIY